MDIEQLKQIQDRLIAKGKKQKPKSKNFNPYTYNSEDLFRNTEGYSEYLEEYYSEVQD